jgi:hypothetical protein
MTVSSMFFVRLLLLLVVLAMIVGMTVLVEKYIPSTMKMVEKTVEKIPIVDESAEITQTSCETAGGTWNPCGSACREDPSAVCIQVCVAYCECASNESCPKNFACGQYVDSVGVCSPK